MTHIADETVTEVVVDVETQVDATTFRLPMRLHRDRDVGRLYEKWHVSPMWPGEALQSWYDKMPEHMGAVPVSGSLDFAKHTAEEYAALIAQAVLTMQVRDRIDADAERDGKAVGNWAATMRDADQ